MGMAACSTSLRRDGRGAPAARPGRSCATTFSRPLRPSRASACTAGRAAWLGQAMGAWSPWRPPTRAWQRLR
eukprot:904882-Lingulodinium_polyedra.AAC.1